MSIQETNLKAIADAIREKEGSVEPIPASEFPARILALETGGIPEGTYMIALESSDPDGGVLSGGGLASERMMVTVRAETAEGYKFAGWQESGEIVSEDAEYTFTVAGDRELVAAFEEGSTGRLPEGYVEVERIESTGEEYINTDVNPSGTIKISLDIEPTKPPTSSSTSFFGANIGYKYFQVSHGLDGISVITGSAADKKMISSNYEPRRMLVVVDAASAIASIYNENTISLSIENLYSSNKINLFANGSSGMRTTAKLYSCKMEISDELVRDFVPCIDPTGAVGLYDLVEGKFYGNAGTGAFTAGPAV